MEFRSLPGHVAYEDARRLQAELVERRARDEIPDTVLFLEHAAVVTRGRGLQWTGAPRERAMPLDPALLPAGTGFSESERGGDLTYHGPGQLVIYPIVKLDGRGWGPERDVGAYLRKLERVLIADLAARGLSARATSEATGVWVAGATPDAPFRKVASIGVAVRRWVTWHGMAVNAVNDLAPFALMSPCGFPSEVMTRLADLPARAGLPEGAGWRGALEERLRREFSRTV